MNLLRFIGYRTLVMLTTLLVISLLVFVIIQLAPGDYLTTYMAELQAEGETNTAEKIAFLKELYGLDRPLPVQYLSWIAGFPFGNFGYSFEYGLPVSEVIGDRLFLTLLLNFATVLFVYLVAFPVGMFVAVRQHTLWDRGLTFAGYLGLATPNFLLALILLYLSNAVFGVSIGGLMDPAYADAPWSSAKILSVMADRKSVV